MIRGLDRHLSLLLQFALGRLGEAERHRDRRRATRGCRRVQDPPALFFFFFAEALSGAAASLTETLPVCLTLTISCLPLTAKLNALLAGTPCSTFASDALAAGVGIHALARIMGTSVRMIERSYGILLDGALESDRRSSRCARPGA